MNEIVDLSLLGSFSAQRASRPHFPRQRLTGIQKTGLSYEKKVALALRELGTKHGLKVEHGPWFEYKLSGSGELSFCQPDIILHNSSLAIVIEVKLAATPLALEKLEDLYVPIVEAVLRVPAQPLIITRSLNAWNKTSPGRPSLDHGLSFTASFFETLNSVLPLYLWSGRGKIT